MRTCPLCRKVWFAHQRHSYSKISSASCVILAVICLELLPASAPQSSMLRRHGRQFAAYRVACLPRCESSLPRLFFARDYSQETKHSDASDQNESDHPPSDEGAGLLRDAIAPRVALSDASRKHHDLTSFLEYASMANLNTTSTTYKGTHYEYTVVEALKTLSFDLTRIGRSNDLGVDLVGTWHLPVSSSPIKVLVQCKASKNIPAMIRELEGAYVGAPSGWQSGAAMAFLVTTHPSTAGVRDALQRSQLPLGFAQVSADGHVEQLWWNRVAAEPRLEGLSTTTVYRQSNAEGGLGTQLSLRYQGKPWRTKPPAPT